MLPQTDPLRAVAAPLLAEIKAGLATEPRASERVGLLLRIARAEKLIGNPAEVKKALDKAVALARTVGGEPPLWPSIALDYFELGDPLTAKAVLAEALQRAQKRPKPEERGWHLLWVASAQATRKDRTAVQSTLALAKKASPRVASDEAKGFISQILASAGEFTAAKQLALSLKSDPVNALLALTQVALQQQKAGDRAGAKATLAQALQQHKALKDEGARAFGSEVLLPALVELGQVDGAKRLAGSDPKLRQALGNAFAEADNLTEAKPLLTEPSSALAYALARSGDVVGAQAEAERVIGNKSGFTMQDEPERLLAAIARAQALKGESEGAQANLKRAYSLAESDTTFGNRRIALLSSTLDSLLRGGKR